MRKRDSKRRWKARMKLGKDIPHWAVMDFGFVLPRGYLPDRHDNIWRVCF